MRICRGKRGMRATADRRPARRLPDGAEGDITCAGMVAFYQKVCAVLLGTRRLAGRRRPTVTRPGRPRRRPISGPGRRERFVMFSTPARPPPPSPRMARFRATATPGNVHPGSWRSSGPRHRTSLVLHSDSSPEAPLVRIRVHIYRSISRRSSASGRTLTDAALPDHRRLRPRTRAGEGDPARRPDRRRRPSGFEPRQTS